MLYKRGLDVWGLNNDLWDNTVVYVDFMTYPGAHDIVRRYSHVSQSSLNRVKRLLESYFECDITLDNGECWHLPVNEYDYPESPTGQDLFELTHNMTDLCVELYAHDRNCDCPNCNGEYPY